MNTLLVIFARSTGSLLGDFVAYAIIGIILYVIAFIWQIIKGGGRGRKGGEGEK